MLNEVIIPHLLFALTTDIQKMDACSHLVTAVITTTQTPKRLKSAEHLFYIKHHSK